jgi:hypothetical protein
MFNIHFTAFWRDLHLDLDPGFSGMTIHPLPPPPNKNKKLSFKFMFLKQLFLETVLGINTPQ